jgi:hypothetical protein
MTPSKPAVQRCGAFNHLHRRGPDDAKSAGTDRIPEQVVETLPPAFVEIIKKRRKPRKNAKGNALESGHKEGM